MKGLLLATVLSFAITATAQDSAPTQAPSTPKAASADNSSGPSRPRAANTKAEDRVTKEVRHELVMLPFYGVFDNLAYKVLPDGTVVLLGQVSRPSLKSDAENAVKRIEGVESVDNQIKVLPTSPNDDRIRRDTYRALYSNEVLSPYQLRAVPPIHIIVDNGNVTLEGVVSRAMDKQVAEMQAKSVSGVFAVTDHLQVESD